MPRRDVAGELGRVRSRVTFTARRWRSRLGEASRISSELTVRCGHAGDEVAALMSIVSTSSVGTRCRCHLDELGVLSPMSRLYLR